MDQDQKQWMVSSLAELESSAFSVLQMHLYWGSS